MVFESIVLWKKLIYTRTVTTFCPCFDSTKSVIHSRTSRKLQLLQLHILNTFFNINIAVLQLIILLLNAGLCQGWILQDTPVSCILFNICHRLTHPKLLYSSMVTTNKTVKPDFLPEQEYPCYNDQRYYISQDFRD